MAGIDKKNIILTDKKTLQKITQKMDKLQKGIQRLHSEYATVAVAVYALAGEEVPMQGQKKPRARKAATQASEAAATVTMGGVAEESVTSSSPPRLKTIKTSARKAAVKAATNGRGGEGEASDPFSMPA